jgi:hypothetical protein
MPFPPCPRCGESDLSRATAAIVAAGTRRTESVQRSVGAVWTDDDVIPVTSSGTTSAVQQSELARILDFPAPEPPTGLAGCLGIGLLVAGAGLAVVTFAVTFLIGGALGDPWRIIVALAVAVVLAAVVGCLPAAAGFAAVSVARNGRARWETSHEAWGAARPIADRLIYCGRDHVVYDPQNGAWMPPENAGPYCYQRAAAAGPR